MDFYGFPRPDGQVGARNFIALIPTTGCVNTVALQIEKLVDNTRAFCHTKGCLYPPGDTKRVTNTLINLANNPNVAGALLIGLGCEMVNFDEVMEGCKKSGKPIRGVQLHKLGGHLETVFEGAKLAAELVLEASKIRREKFGLDKLCFCTKCGSSDTTSGLSANLAVGEVCRLMTAAGGTFVQGEICDIMGGEYALKDLCVHKEDGDKIVGYVKDLYNRGLAVGADVRGDQVTTGNRDGGLTTLTEKAMGANAKGQECPIVGTIDYGNHVKCLGGRNIISTPGHGFENLTGGAAAGAQLILFTTGRGAPNGHPCIPAIKLCGNTKTVKNLSEHIDFAVDSIINEEETVAQAGERLFEFAIDVANGTLTKAEILKFTGMDILTYGPTL